MRVWLLGTSGNVTAMQLDDDSDIITSDSSVIAQLHEDELSILLAGSEEQLAAQVCTVYAARLPVWEQHV